MASTQVETVSTNTDKVKLSLAVVLVLASLVGFYMLSKQGQIAQWGVLLAGLVAAVLRVRGTGGTPPQRGGWRELSPDELR